MTFLAGDSGKHMLAVIEINKIRKVVNLHPLDRLLLLNRFLQLFNLDRLLFQHIVAIHADAGRRDSRMAAGARRVVTVEAGNLVVAGGDLVRESNRLGRRISLVHPDLREFIGPAASGNEQPQDTEYEKSATHEG